MNYKSGCGRRNMAGLYLYASYTQLGFLKLIPLFGMFRKKLTVTESAKKSHF
jgi:hypothetical protein